jgi:exosortase E/protease (VPEID-CTERM system)
LQAVHGLLALITTPSVYRPAEFIVGTDTFSVSIAPQCSGYEGIGLVLAFLAAYLWLGRRQLRFPQAWLLLPLGITAIWLANVLRIGALVMIGTWISAGIATDGFHSQAGWIAFNVVALGLLLLAQRWRFVRRDDGASVITTAGPSREAVYLAPLLAIVAAATIGAAFSTGGLDRFYPARLAAIALPLWLYRREYAAMRWTCSWQAPAIGLLVFALWTARWPEAPESSSARSMMMASGGIAWTSVWLAARVIGSVLTVPLAEELAFRGFLTRRLISSDFDAVPPGRFTWASFAISSIAFGVLHDRWLEGTMAGMLYALAYYRRGSLGDAVAAHATTNALLCTAALMTGDWSLFS